MFLFICLHKVKIGNDGTVTVSSHCWETAKACTTPNGMARVLLMGLFSVEDVLLKSNLKAPASWIPLLSVGRLLTRGKFKLYKVNSFQSMGVELSQED